MSDKQHGGKAGGELIAKVTGEPTRHIGSAEPRQRLGSVRWEGYSHGKMWGMLMRSHPDSMFAKAHDWEQLGTEIEELNTSVQQHLSTVLHTWRGSAAAGMAGSGTNLLNWSSGAAETTRTVAADLQNYTNALVRARHAMPQPRHATAESWFRDGAGATVASGPEGAYMLHQLLTDHQASAHEVKKAKAEAVRVMRTFEQESRDIEQGIGHYHQAPVLTNPGQPADPSVYRRPHPPAPRPTPASSPLTRDDSPSTWFDDPVAGETTSAAGVGTGSVGVNGGGIGANGNPLGGPSGAGGIGRDGIAEPIRGGLGASPALGSGGVGGVGPTADGALDGGRFGAASRGVTGGGGIYPPMSAGGARGDQDTVHKRSRYVVGEDLFDDDRATAPPVFGAWPPDYGNAPDVAT